MRSTRRARLPLPASPSWGRVGAALLIASVATGAELGAASTRGVGVVVFLCGIVAGVQVGRWHYWESRRWASRELAARRRLYVRRALKDGEIVDAEFEEGGQDDR